MNDARTESTSTFNPYAWLEGHGFAALVEAKKHFSIELAGCKFEADHFVFREGCRDESPRGLTCHFNENERHAGWIGLTHSADGCGVRWTRSKILNPQPYTFDSEPKEKLLLVGADGCASSLSDAAQEALSVTFEERKVEGMIFHDCGNGKWLHASSACAAEVVPSYDGSGYVWRCNPARLESFFELTGCGKRSIFSYHPAKTLDEALVLTATYEKRVLSAMAQMTVEVNAYELGKADGRSELLKQIAALS